jgi:hypothetical protein
VIYVSDGTGTLKGLRMAKKGKIPIMSAEGGREGCNYWK